MAYKLAFKPEDTKLFELVYEGFMRTARPSNREEHRATNAILDKLESLSSEDPSAIIMGFDPADPLAPKVRRMKPEGGYGIFEEPQYRYLKDTLDKLSGPAPFSRMIERAHNWIDAATQGDAKTLVTGAE